MDCFFGRSHTYLLGVRILSCFYLTKLKFALLSHLPDWMALPHSKCGRMSWNCACTSSSMLSRCLNILRIYGKVSQQWQLLHSKYMGEFCVRLSNTIAVIAERPFHKFSKYSSI